MAEQELRKLGDREFAALAIQHFGWKRALELFGFCCWWGLSDYLTLPKWDDRVEGFASSPTRWRVYRDLKEFGIWLRSQGLYVEDESVEQISARMARAAAVGAAGAAEKVRGIEP